MNRHGIFQMVQCHMAQQRLNISNRFGFLAVIHFNFFNSSKQQNYQQHTKRIRFKFNLHTKICQNLKNKIDTAKKNTITK